MDWEVVTHKASQLEECMDALEQVISSLDEAESNAESVEFPGMY
jgi:exonuclease VII small subunit